MDTSFEPLIACFHSAEREVLHRLLGEAETLPSACAEEIQSAFRQANRTLPSLAQAMDACPLPTASQRLGGRVRTAGSLVESLCQEEWLPSDFSVPTGAILRRAFVLARINFLKALKYCLSPCQEETRELLDAVQELVDDAIFGKLAEELLTAAVANPLNVYATRRAAAQKLLAVWNEPRQQAVPGFPDALLSAWRARRRVRTIYGTLVGFAEVLSLVREQCEGEFISFFTRDEATPDEAAAFREFLFGLPYEEICRLEKYMQDEGISVISPEQVKQVIGALPGPPPTSDHPNAEEIYASYYRRRVRSEYRALSSNAGPHKTAEGYLIENLLRREAREGGEG